MTPEPSPAEELAGVRGVSASVYEMQALQQRRLLAFVIHFASTTVQFLNNFLQNCDEKLLQFERQLESLEAAMVLLESKLQSIPEVMILLPESQEKEIPMETISENPENIPPTTVNSMDTQDSTPEQCNNSYPEYERFVKMVQVGVPLEAAKLKCALEGLDPQVLNEIIGK